MSNKQNSPEDLTEDLENFKNLFELFFDFLKKYVLECEQLDTVENEFRKSLLLVVSRAFCESKPNEALYISMKMILLSFNSVKSVSFNDLKEPEQKLLKNSLEAFQRIVFTPKYKNALWTLVKSINLRCKTEELNEKFENVLKHIGSLNPILIRNVALNGMISCNGNFFINVDTLLPLKNLNNSYLRKVKLAR